MAVVLKGQSASCHVMVSSNDWDTRKAGTKACSSSCDRLSLQLSPRCLANSRHLFSHYEALTFDFAGRGTILSLRQAESGNDSEIERSGRRFLHLSTGRISSSCYANLG